MAASSPIARVLRLRVPGLIERPAVGTSCCASTAEAIIAQELSMLPGVEDVAIDCATGRVEVTYQPALVDAAAISASLADIGYPPEPV